MDIIKTFQDFHAATDVEKKIIGRQVKTMFHSLPDNEKKEVQKIFLKSLDNKINEAKALIEEVNLEMELVHA